MKTLTRTLTVSILLFAVLTPALPAHGFLEQLTGCGKPVEDGAGAGAVEDANKVKVADDEVQKNTGDVRDKECVGDRLQHALTQALIATVTDSIITWINSGFEGGPAFVTNYSFFYQTIADNVAVDFIDGHDLGFLCSPFEIPVRAALTRNYQAQQNFSSQISCSLGDVTNNIGGFLQGDFSQGGWRALFSLSTDFRNNPLYSYTRSLDELDNRIASEQFVQREELTGGIRSKGKCTLPNDIVLNNNIVEDADGNELDVTRRNDCLSVRGASWQITSPSSQISSTLSRVLQLPLDKLAEVDEFGEALSAVYIALVEQLFVSLDGLSGLSSNTSSSSFNGRSYVNQLTTDTGALSLTQARDVLVADVTLAIGLEETYQIAADEILAGYQGAKESFETLSQQCSSSSNAGASGVVASAANTLTAIETITTDYTNQKETSINTVGELVAIRAAAQTATTENALNSAGDSYETLLNQGRVHSAAATSLELVGQRNTFAQYRDDIIAGSSTCGF